VGDEPGEATNYGYEIEIRKNLGFFGNAFSKYSTNYFENFTLLGNFSRVWSKIDVLREQGTRIVKDSRALQGQAPWTINLGFMFDEPHINTSFSILYNKIGRRTATIGVDEDRKRDIWLEPTDMLDMAVKHKLAFFDNMDIKFTVKNILDEDETLTFGRTPSDRPGREDYLHKIYSEGTKYSLHLTYKY
jgi:outer membrane receptor protein involved in Fe transport